MISLNKGRINTVNMGGQMNLVPTTEKRQLLADKFLPTLGSSRPRAGAQNVCLPNGGSGQVC